MTTDPGKGHEWRMENIAYGHGLGERVEVRGLLRKLQAHREGDRPSGTLKKSDHEVSLCGTKEKIALRL